MKAKLVAGATMALTLALAGCGGNKGGGGGLTRPSIPTATPSPSGGGGATTATPRQQAQGAKQPSEAGSAPTRTTVGTQGASSGTAAKAPVQTKTGTAQKPMPTRSGKVLQDATKNASAARSSVAKKDWAKAQSELRRTKEDLSAAEKVASRDLKADIKEAEKLAKRAERSVRSQAATAQRDLDRLVTRLNQIALREQPVQGGGGKPASKGSSGTTGRTR